MEEAQIFVCRGCGKCCRNIKQGDSESSETDMVKVMDDKGTGIPVMDWELDRIRAGADRLGVFVDLVPHHVLLSSKDDIIVATWSLNHNVCPFIGEDRRCRIYEDRPMVCRAYPLSMKRGADGSKGVVVSTDCPGVRGLEVKDPQKTFGSTYTSCRAFYNQGDFMAVVIKSLQDRRQIKPFDIDRKRMRRKYESGHYRFMDFLERSGFARKDELGMQLSGK